MTASIEIVTCLAAIAGSVKLTVTHYTRLRKDRQMRQALLVALSEMA
jgi:hypothetical protein